jgi:histone-lysine N-methyltransferase MLL3
VEAELKNLTVLRKVYVNREERRQVAAVIHQEEKKFHVRIGSLIVKHVGQLLPHQIQTGNFHTKDYIYPVSEDSCLG